MKVQVFVCTEVFYPPFGRDEVTEIIKVFYKEEDAHKWALQKTPHRDYTQVDIQ